GRRSLRRGEAERKKSIGEGRLGDDRRLGVALHHQPFGMKERARPGPSPPVDGIADERKSEPFEGMNPKLVGAPGFRAEAQQAARPDHCELFPMRHRGLAPSRAIEVANHPPACLGGRYLGERQVDRALLTLGNAVENGEILLLDSALLEGAREAPVRLRIAREQKTTRGVAVEPVDRKRPALEAETERIEMVFE